MEPATYPVFKDAVNKVFPVIKEAATKERALMGSKTLLGGGNGNTPHKRKRDSDVVEDTTTSDYFFAKYLTSAELLDLEVRLIYARAETGSLTLTGFSDCRSTLSSAVLIPTPHRTAASSHFHKSC